MTEVVASPRVTIAEGEFLNPPTDPTTAPRRRQRCASTPAGARSDSFFTTRRAARARFRAVTDVTVYEKPTCTTCRKLFELLTERGIDMERVNYHVAGLTEEEIRELLRKAGAGPRDVLRAREPLYAELGLADGGHSDDELIALMAQHPQLVQRPIVVRGDRAVLARPIERALELLDG